VDNIKVELVDIGWSGPDWIDLAQDRDKWRALANAVMKFGRFHKMLGNYRVTTQLMDSPLMLSSI
jgi:hypothetical protein